MLNNPATQFGQSCTHCQTALRVRSSSDNGWRWRQRFSHSSGGSVKVIGESEFARSPKLARLEAALFVADRALSLRKLTQMATLADTKEAQSLIEMLNNLYDEGNSAFRIESVASGFKLLTLPSLSKWLDRIHDRQAYMKLSAPAMETLSIIAYRQPCTRADVEAIRGVQASEMIKQLMEKGLARVVGEDDTLGRPYLYGTTKLFLESFGLTHVNQLPMADQLKKEKEIDEDSESQEAETVNEETDPAEPVSSQR